MKNFKVINGNFKLEGCGNLKTKQMRLDQVLEVPPRYNSINKRHIQLSEAKKCVTKYQKASLLKDDKEMQSLEESLKLPSSFQRKQSFKDSKEKTSKIIKKMMKSYANSRRNNHNMYIFNTS
ncbi:unnamed protein product [Moneuplotes crassus]|uniref:Uncharacterized protein n=1 Tax=Euplotes crassus TaxID=5936 RepID=A0AAD1UP82_EUPCR|nr:unnamed protein product [Moneuplotes crassus]